MSRSHSMICYFLVSDTDRPPPQMRLTTPKAPQPLVDLVDVASLLVPARLLGDVYAAVWEFAVLQVQVMETVLDGFN